jgi:misacylated tRNA(Ala) deacylase
MTGILYLEDSYLREVDATITSVKDDRYVTLDQTIFYPKGGGQPNDTGNMTNGPERYNVVYVGKLSGEVSHEVDRPGLQIGDKVHCVLDWDRRYKLMRTHTASHLFASLLCNGTGALVTGNQLEEDKVRFDFSLEKFDKDTVQFYIDKANEFFRRDISVRTYELPREEALKIPGIIKMAEAYPPNVPNLRVVEIDRIDLQADGGTHVRNLKEVGRIELLKIENKGKQNRRIYFKLAEPETRMIDKD